MISSLPTQWDEIADVVVVGSGGAALTAATPLNQMVVTRNHDTGRTRDNDDLSLVNQTELTWKLATGSVKHTLLTGVELASERLNRVNYALDANPATAAIRSQTR